MFLELIAVFVAGFAGAGLMLLLARITGNRLPRWIIPLGAGAAMMATAISNEYSWYSRTASNLPEGLVVADTVQSSALWRPWSLVFPMTTRFVAVDTSALRPNSQTEGLYMADLYFFGRWQTVQAVEVMADCPGGRRADPALGDGSPPVWRAVGPQDPILRAVCGAL